jgi:hypothetical protein
MIPQNAQRSKCLARHRGFLLFLPFLPLPAAFRCILPLSGASRRLPLLSAAFLPPKSYFNPKS